VITVTQQAAFDALDYDPVTGMFARRGNSHINPRVQEGQRAGSLARDGYRYVRIGKQRYLEHRLAWFMSFGEWPKEIDHINGVKDDNRIANLRNVTRGQNMANAPRQVNNTSGHKGVSFDKTNRKWIAYVTVAGKQKNLGRFDSINDAVAVRSSAFRKAFGDCVRA